MAHFAEIGAEDKVLRVLVIDDEHEADGETYLAETLGLGGTWIQTSYNTSAGVHRLGGTPLRKNYAGVGMTYDSVRDAFIPEKPYESWILDEDKCIWNAPIPYPSDNQIYSWDEITGNWILLSVVEE